MTYTSRYKKRAIHYDPHNVIQEKEFNVRIPFINYDFIYSFVGTNIMHVLEND